MNNPLAVQKSKTVEYATGERMSWAGIIVRAVSDVRLQDRPAVDRTTIDAER